MKSTFGRAGSAARPVALERTRKSSGRRRRMVVGGRLLNHGDAAKFPPAALDGLPKVAPGTAEWQPEPCSAGQQQPTSTGQRRFISRPAASISQANGLPEASPGQSEARAPPWV